MDRITESFLQQFAESSEITMLAQDQQFEHFASYVTMRRHYNGEAIDTSDVVTGSGGDTGIDGIAIIVNGSLVTDVESLEEHADLSGNFDVTFVFVQAERSSSFDAAKIGTFGFGVRDFFEAKPRLARNKRVQELAEVMAVLYQQGTKFKPDNPACRLYYVTTGSWVGDANLEARRAAVVEDLRSMQIFREVEFECVGGNGVQKLYRQTKNAITREFVFASKTLVPDITGVTEAYVGFIPMSEFLKIVSDESGDLVQSIFYDNVRDWQDYNAVNAEIRETLVSDHRSRFVLMNNGITIIAQTLRMLRRDRVQIEDFQVVNGCQTSHVLFDQRNNVDASVMIPLRLIATQDDGVTNSIIRATNRQTKVEEEQFFALTEFAEQLEAYFQTFPEPRKLYYERRSRQYARLSIHSTRIITHGNLVRSVASMLLDVPHQTTRSYKAIKGSVGKEIFAKGQKLDPYYISAFAYYRLDVNFRTQRIDAKLKPARFHILLALRLLANPASVPRLNASQMEAYCGKITRVLWDATKTDDLIARAARIVEEVAEGNFNRDNIRTLPFTEKVIARCNREHA
jgi:AIPR protein